MVARLAVDSQVPPWVVFVALFTTGGTALLLYLQGAYRRHSVRQVIKRKREEGREAVRRLQKHVEGQKIDKKLSRDILKLTAVELHTALQSGKVKAVDALRVYQKKAIEENTKLNFIVEPIAEAEEWAAARDKQKGKKGILHGMPVSLKENMRVKGRDSTVGVASLIDQPAYDDCVLVKVLKDQGAVPFMRTNVPQTQLSFDCSNPIYGKTLNPHDPIRTPGGSSGGEGTILGSGASILGIGSDIAGSIRIPCHFCGVAGLKPTKGRLSTRGMRSLTKPQNTIQGTGGAMARDVDGLALLMRALLSPLHFKLDSSLPPIPFQEKIYTASHTLRIGYYTFDGYIQPVPACRRAVLITKDALEKKGHTLVPFDPPRVSQAVSQLCTKVMCGDGGQNILDYVKDDVIDDSTRKSVSNSRLPRIVRKMLAKLGGWMFNDKVHEDFIWSMMGCRSVSEWWNLSKQVTKYRQEFHDAWRDKDLDAIICPMFAFTAPPYGYFFETFGDIMTGATCGAGDAHSSGTHDLAFGFCDGGGTYSILYNMVNYPAGSLPVTKVTEKDCEEMKDYRTDTMFTKNIKKVTEGSEGLPVAVQVVGQQWQEELVLRIMKEIEDSMATS